MGSDTGSLALTTLPLSTSCARSGHALEVVLSLKEPATSGKT